MTDEEIIYKFKQMAKKVMRTKQMNELIDVVFHLDQVKNIKELTQLMIFDN
jgi:hypothetical protein